MSLQIATVTNSIAGLTVSGVYMRDSDQIPQEAIRQTPALVPIPNGFVSGYQQVRQSYGSNSAPAAKYDVSYSLNYRLFYAEVGSGYSLAQIYPKMVAAAFAVIDAVLSNDLIAGCVDIQVEAIQSFGVVGDAVGKMYHGCDLSFRIKEFVN